MIKTVFITGADKGLGFSLSQRFMREGALVFAGQYLPDSNLSDLAKSFPRAFTPILLDITQMDSVCQAANHHNYRHSRYCSHPLSRQAHAGAGKTCIF